MPLWTFLRRKRKHPNDQAGPAAERAEQQAAVRRLRAAARQRQAEHRYEWQPR
ncbi:hypothetical protein O7634_24635 [Micromonospora sp. WMMD1120]|uniref:hypothetical protein n=1 Tax=Micromonospora sp. WMMD1120 TaxID=3016106 RepID=UPI00241799E0|nr:hypothetical protein [Micromonospora sp. WMMD1120]MDG4809951.1 hypothetical protein [Micromonospora sp. WMMD1120]